VLKLDGALPDVIPFLIVFCFFELKKKTNFIAPWVPSAERSEAQSPVSAQRPMPLDG
jgi:hypothetical protein